MVVTIEIKKYIAYIYTFGVIISKFHYCYKLYLVILLFIYKETKVYLYHILLFFCLTVYLKIKCGKKLLFDVKKATKQEPELRCKNRSAITNNRIGETIILYYHIDNYVCKSWSTNNNFNWLVVYYFGLTIDNNENKVVVITFLVNRYQQTFEKTSSICLVCLICKFMSNNIYL